MLSEYENQIDHASRLGTLFGSLYTSATEENKTIEESLREKYNGDVENCVSVDSFGRSYSIIVKTDYDKKTNPLVTTMLLDSNFMGTNQRRNKDELLQKQIEAFESTALDLINQYYKQIDETSKEYKHIIVDFYQTGNVKYFEIKLYCDDLLM